MSSKANKSEFTDNLMQEIITVSKKSEKASDKKAKVLLPKKVQKKDDKKSFPLYMKQDKVKELDKICKKTGYSRNELINLLIDKGLEIYGIKK